MYAEIIPLFEKALGVYYQSSYYVAKPPSYKAETVYFDRFCYDFISLFGVNILFLDIPNLEEIIRKVYVSVSYNFDIIIIKGEDEERSQGGLRLIDIECIQSPFSEEHFLNMKKQLKLKSKKVSGDGKTTVSVYKRQKSEIDFTKKVNFEKKRTIRKKKKEQQESESDKSFETNSNDDDSVKPGQSMLVNMLNPEQAKAEIEKKKAAKRELVEQMRIVKESMRPFVLFNGVKDNPIPY